MNETNFKYDSIIIIIIYFILSDVNKHNIFEMYIFPLQYGLRLGFHFTIKKSDYEKDLKNGLRGLGTSLLCGNGWAKKYSK